jgi:hypothetical protein
MPRNITITLADGSQHVYANAPDDITPDAVTARAQKDFGQGVTALDGGKNPSAAPAPAKSPDGVRNAFGLGAPPPRGTSQRQEYDAEYNRRFNTAWLAANPGQAARRGTSLPPGANVRETQLARARTDPAFAARLATAEKTRLAQRSSQQGDLDAFDAAGSAQGGGFGTGYLGGFVRGTFGLGERLGAAEATYLPTWLGGRPGNATYDQNLAKIRANTDAQMDRSATGAALGQLTSGTAVTAGAGAGVGAGASRLAASGAPIAARAGNVLQGLMTLRKGQKLANAGKLVLSGATAGGAQALGEGSDPIKGAAYGAGGAAVLGGGFKAAQVLTRPFRDFLRVSSAGQILSRLTSATRDQLETRAAEYRTATGAEPTLFELLPLADRNKILKQAVVGRDNVVEAASGAIRRRAGGLGPEMRARAQQILDPRRAQIQGTIADDLATARGGTPGADDPALAARAISDSTDLLDVRTQEANAIMAPHENTPVVNSLDELMPNVPGPNGTRMPVDPEVSRSIASVAGNIRARPDGNPITAGEISAMMTKLRGSLGQGTIESNAAEDAINHLQGVLDNAAPEAGAASRAMTDAYAARSRMAEGMSEGGKSRLRSDVDVGTSNTQARKVRNAYDTPEGTAGRALGQGNRILSNLTGSPEDALKATVDLSRSRSGRALAENLGAPEAEAIGTAARAQDQSAQALAAASSKASGSDGAAADAETLVSALAGLHPSGFLTTKAGAVRKLIDMTYIPENRARTMVDMVFSQDPVMSARALRAIGNEPNGAAFIKRLAGTVGQLSSEGTGTATDPNVEDVPMVPVEAETSTENAGEPAEEPPVAAPSKPGDDPNVPYGRAVISSLFPTAEITDDVRDPNSELGKKNPGSEHIKSQNAVDIRPIPGMTFAQYIGKINDAGYKVVEAIDEVNHPSKWATGPHWHVVVV